MKRIFLSFAMLSITLVAMFAQKSVYSVNFYDEAQLEGWTVGQHWKFSQDKGAEFYARFANGADTLISPIKNISELVTPSIRLQMENIANLRWTNQIKVFARNSESADFEQVYVSNNPTETPNTKFELPVKFVGATNFQIQIIVAYDGGASTSISQVSLENATKLAPSTQNTAVSPAYNSVKINFTNYAMLAVPQKLNFKIHTEPFSYDMTTMIDVKGYENPIYQTDKGTLTPNTKYYLAMQGDFGEDGLSDWFETSFTTESFISSFPYIVDFEEPLDSNIQIVRSTTSTSSTYNTYDKVSATQKYNGDSSFHFQASSGKRGYILLPAIDGNLADYQISFVAMKDNSDRTANITIGVVSDASAEDFYEIKTISLPTLNKWETCVVQFNDYSGDASRIMIRAGNARSDNSLYIDSIVVQTKQECPPISSLKTTKVEDMSAIISWHDGSDNFEWNVHISELPISNTDQITNPIPGAIYDNPFVINSGLSPDRNYYVYVQPACGGAWDSVHFKTNPTFACPFIDSINTYGKDLYNKVLPPYWAGGALNPSTGSNVTTAAYIPKLYRCTTENCATTGYNHSQTAKGFDATIKTATTPSNLTYFVLPKLNNDLAEYALEFYLCTEYSTAENYELYIGFATQQSSELGSADYFMNYVHVTDTLLIPSLVKLQGWQRITTPLNKYNVAYGNYIVIGAKSLGTTSTTSARYLHFDDIRIGEIPADCTPVMNFKTAKISSHAVKLSWKETLKATKWHVKASHNKSFKPENDGGDVFDTIVETQECVLTNGLQPNETLYCAVSPACDEDNRVWSEVKMVVTDNTTQLPYFNNFNSETAASGASVSSVFSPKYWTNGNSMQVTKNSYTPYVKSQSWSNAANIYRISGEYNCLDVYSYNNTAYKPYAIMPAIEDIPMNKVYMSFYAYYATASHPGILKIGVTDNLSTGLDNVTLIKQIKLKQNQQPELIYVDFADYTGQGKNIVFYNDTNATNEIYIDNLTISTKDDLWQPTNVTVTDTTENSISIKWTENGTATDWLVRTFKQECLISKNRDTMLSKLATGDHIVTGGTPETTIQNLQPGTRNFIYLQPLKINGTDTTFGPWSIVVDQYTNCGPISIPFTQNFNSYTAPNGKITESLIGPCYGIETATAPNMYNYTSSVYPTPDGNYLRFYVTSSSPTQQIILPPFSNNINTLQLSVDAAIYSTGYVGDVTATQFGVVTDDGTFNLVEEKQIDDNTKEWKKWIIDFSSYTGPNGRIAIRMQYNGGTGYINIDNVVIETLPTCKPPRYAKITQMNYNSATIAWEKMENTTGWDIALLKTPTDNPDTITNFFTTTSNQYNAQNLEAATNYYAYIRTKNGTTCTGQWSDPLSFKTHYAPFSTPFYTDFQYYTGGTTSGGLLIDSFILVGDVTDTRNASTYKNSSIATSPVVKISQSNKTYTNYCVLPLVECNDVRDLQLKMRVYSGTTRSATIYKTDALQVFEIGAFVNPYDLSTYSAIITDTIIIHPDGKYATKEVQYNFLNYVGDAQGRYGKYLAIRVYSYFSGTSELSGSINIDNLEISQHVDCTEPYDLKIADEKFATTVDLSWKGNTNFNYEIRTFRVSMDSIDPDSDTPEQTIIVNKKTDTTITNLVANTYYISYARSICGNNYSKWSTPVKFTTGCDVIQPLPYYETFDNVAVDNKPECWTDYTDLPGANSSATAIRISSNKLYNELYFSNNSSSPQYSPKIFTPAFNEKLENIVIYFDAYSYSSSASSLGTIEIGAVDQPTISAKPYFITNIKLNYATPNRYAVRLSDFGPFFSQPKYLYFTCRNGSLYMDNFYFTTAEENSTLLPVVNLHTTKIATNSISVAFEEGTNWTSSWDVACVLSGQEPTETENITITSHTFSNLNPNTAYDIFVRSKYNETSGKWTKLENILTYPIPDTLPYTTNFENATDNDKWIMDNPFMYKTSSYTGKTSPNHFIFGAAAKCLDENKVPATGTTALYVTSDTTHTTDTFGIDNNGPINICRTYRDFHFERGTYRFVIKQQNRGALDQNGTRNTQYVFYTHLVPVGTVTNPTTPRQYVTPSGYSVNAESVTTKAENGTYLIQKGFYSDTWDTLDVRVNVEQEGDYQFVLLWYGNNFQDRIIRTPIAIDSISISKLEGITPECSKPSNLVISTIDDTSATFTFTTNGGTEHQCVLTEKGVTSHPFSDTDKQLQKDTITENTFTITGMQPCKDYDIYVRTKCGESDYTDEAKLTFRTRCSTQDLPYNQQFATFYGSSKYQDCEIMTSGSVVSNNFILDNETITSIVNGDTAKGITLDQNAYLILPQFKDNIQDLYVELWLATTATDILPYAELGVVENPEDPTNTFQPLHTFLLTQFAGSLSSAPRVIERFSGLLNKYTGSGKYIAIRNATSKSTTLYMKYVRVTNAQFPPITNFIADQTTTTSAQLKWIKAKNETSWKLKISCTDEETRVDTLNETDVTVENDIVTYQLTNLTPGNIYSVFVQALWESNDTSEWSTPISFATGCSTDSLPFTEDFSSLNCQQRQLQYECWQNKICKGPIESVFNGAEELSLPAANLYFNYLWCQNWLQNVIQHNEKAILSQNNYNSSDRNGTQWNKWLISPAIYIPNEENTEFFMTFNAKYCNNKGERTTNNGDRFFVAVSTDDGLTWKQNNAKEFKLTNDIDMDYFLKIQTLDLTKFKGQNIRFAFYHEAVQSNIMGSYILIDDIKINKYVTEHQTDHVCEGYGYSKYGVDLSPDEIPASNQSAVYSTIVPYVPKTGDDLLNKADTIFNLTLTTYSTTENTLYDTLCADTCVIGGLSFNYGILNPDMPYLAYLDNQYGCDSLVYVYLSNPIADTIEINVPLATATFPYTFDKYLTINHMPTADTTLFTEIDSLNQCGVKYINKYKILLGTAIPTLHGDITKIEVYDCLGRLITTQNKQNSTRKLNLPAGVYLLRYYYTNGTTKITRQVFK